jgi:hypothetical protein
MSGPTTGGYGGGSSGAGGGGGTSTSSGGSGNATGAGGLVEGAAGAAVVGLAAEIIGPKVVEGIESLRESGEGSTRKDNRQLVLVGSLFVGIGLLILFGAGSFFGVFLVLVGLSITLSALFREDGRKRTVVRARSPRSPAEGPDMTAGDGGAG